MLDTVVNMVYQGTETFLKLTWFVAFAAVVVALCEVLETAVDIIRGLIRGRQKDANQD